MNFRISFTLLALAFSLVLSAALAGEIVEQGETTIYAFENVSFNGKDILKIACSDLGIDNDFSIAGDIDGYQEYLKNIEKEFGTDVVFVCGAFSVSGTPFFFLGEFVYIFDGIQYSINNGEYVINGSTGQLREGGASQIIMALTNARRGKSIKLFYGNDSIEFFLNYLP